MQHVIQILEPGSLLLRKWWKLKKDRDASVCFDKSTFLAAIKKERSC